MKVNVKLTGMLAASMRYKEKSIELADGLSVKRLIEELSLPIKAEWLAISVNGVLKDKKYILKDGDEVFIMPAGGAG